MVELTINGESRTVSDHHEHLLAALRDELQITSPKDGCAPSGHCGCCTVLIDGKARIACQTSLQRAERRSIVTLEGLGGPERERLAAAFTAHDALQCGFCTPGILMRTKALLERDKPLTRADASRHLGAHLCRCTGYTKILDAIDSLAAGESPVTVGGDGIGARSARYQAEALSLGDRRFIDDMEPEGCLHAAVVLTQHARADVISIDTSRALVAPGVVAVLDGRDVPGTLRSGVIKKDWPCFIPPGGRTAYLGDVLALVVAETRAQARIAVNEVKVTYDVHEPFTNPADTLASSTNAVWGLEGNMLSRSAYSRGDASEALRRSAYVARHTFQTQRVEHAFLEPESTLAVPTLDAAGNTESLHVFSGGQGVWDDRNDIAAILGVEPARITVELVTNGGAFGGKEDMSNQGQTALAAWLLRRPVKTTFSRNESMLVHAKRHPMRMQYEVGCDTDGRLLGVRAKLLGDSGPYASVGMKVLERAAGHASGPYVTETIDVEAIAVRTNNPVCGAFRGFGANQAQFAMESMMDRLAEMVGISSWEIRSRNVVVPGAVWGPGQIMDEGSLGARACLDAVKPAFDKALSEGRPVGLGLGIKNSGLGNGATEIGRSSVLFGENGTVEVRHGWTEMGQGIHTVARQVAVSELGVDPDQVTVIVDTTREFGAGQTTGSRGTLMVAGSVAHACRNAHADGCRVGVEYPGSHIVDWTDSINDGLENPTVHSTFGYAAQLVELDPDTGEINRVLAAHDVGRAVNPTMCEGQIIGSVHMGLGYALTEGFPCDRQGQPSNETLRSLGIIRPKDMPVVDVILVECADPRSPYGIKGVGEIGLVPTAGAVAAALHAYDGAWRDELPIRNVKNRERASAWT